MIKNKIFPTSLRLFFSILLFAFAVAAQKVPAPSDTLGFTPGDDKKLASWAQVVDYFQKLDAASDRVQFQEIGKTTMGAPFVYATISAPENLKNLEKYKQTNAKLADPRLIKSDQKLADSLIKQGKTIVLITCGIHSTEVGSTLSSMLIAHKLATSNEAEIQKILQNTIVLLVPSLNPDGVDIVKNWYDKTLGTKFEGTTPPELYHKYVGHDNNRDWYAFTQVETQLTVDKIHNVWHPQIVNDIHQQGANGARLVRAAVYEAGRTERAEGNRRRLHGTRQLYFAGDDRQRFRGHHERFDLRCLDTGARLFALSRRRADFDRNGFGAHRFADKSRV